MDIFSLDSYRYFLPDESIAQFPVSPPESARLLVLGKTEIQDTDFFRLPEILPERSIIFINDTRVLKARIKTQAEIIRPSGTLQNRQIELLYLEIVEKEDGISFEAMVFPGDAFPVGARCFVGDYEFMVTEISYRGRVFHSKDIKTEEEIFLFLEKYGEFPIPPYVQSSIAAQENYQTEFADIPGSLAAPTASLHFTKDLLQKISDRGVKNYFATLHVGIGTFKIVNEPDIRNHRIHPEVGFISYEVFNSIAKKRIANEACIGVGTTMIRLLESLPYVWNLLQNKETFDITVQDWWNAVYLRGKEYEERRIQYLSEKDGVSVGASYNFVRIRNESEMLVSFDSSLFIYPGFTPLVATGMITNFHLPESTLLMMISALCGKERIDTMYAHAIKEGYRFYSFGDGCYLSF